MSGIGANVSAAAYVVSDDQLQISVIFSAACGLASVVFFVSTRGWLRGTGGVYQRRLELQDLYLRPPTLEFGGWQQLWGWIPPIFQTNDVELAKCAGFDSVMMNRLYLMGLQIMIPWTVFSVGVLLPVYVFGGMDNSPFWNSGVAATLTIANVPPRSNVVWLPFTFMYMFVFYAVWVLFYHCKSYVEIRNAYFRASDVPLNPEDVEWLSNKPADQKRQTLGSLFYMMINPIHMLEQDRLQWRAVHAQNESRTSAYVPQRTTDVIWPDVRFAALEDLADESKIAEWISGSDNRRAQVDPERGQQIPGDPPDRGAVRYWAAIDEQSSIGVPSGRPLRVGKVNCRNNQLLGMHSENGTFTYRTVANINSYVVLITSVFIDRSDSPHFLHSPKDIKAWKKGKSMLSVPSLAKAMAEEELDPAALLPEYLDESSSEVDDEEAPMKPLMEVPSIRQDYEYEVTGYLSMWLPPDRCLEAQALELIFRSTYPSSFIRLVPVFVHKEVDYAMYRWNHAVTELGEELRKYQLEEQEREARGAVEVEMAEDGFFSSVSSQGSITQEAEAPVAEQQGAEGAAEVEPVAGAEAVPPAAESQPPSTGVPLPLQPYVTKVLDLQNEVLEMRKKAMKKSVRFNYFAIFSDARHAQAAAMCNLSYPVCSTQRIRYFTRAAPAPDDINWPGLWASIPSKSWRLAIVVPMFIVIFLFPIGIITGALTNLQLAICGNMDSNVYWPWYCESDSLGAVIFKGVVSGIFPSIIQAFWDTYVIPIYFFIMASILQNSYALSDMDYMMYLWMFWYGFFNSLLGAIFGGSLLILFSDLTLENFLTVLGSALPQVSNFFIQHCIYVALFTNLLRLAWPHDGSILWVGFRLVYIARPKSQRDEVIIHMPPSYRWARHYGAFMFQFLVAATYSVVAPLIVGCTLVYCFTGWTIWRYCHIYVYERSYEGGGRAFEFVFDTIMASLMIGEMFTSVVFFTNKDYVAAAVLICTLTPFIVFMWYFFKEIYITPSRNLSLDLAAEQPTPSCVDPAVYLPPALRDGAVGWYPEQGKVWEKYGLPKYTT